MSEWSNYPGKELPDLNEDFMTSGFKVPRNGLKAREYCSWIGRRGVIMVCRISKVTRRIDILKVVVRSRVYSRAFDH